MLKLIIIVAQLSLFFALSSAKSERQIKEMVPKYTYINVSGLREYTCDFLNPNRSCVWSINSIDIDPTSIGYSYPNEDNCTIRSNDSDIVSIENLTCTGYFSYVNSIVKTVFSGSVELSCLSTRVMDECVWKRKGSRVTISESYAFVTQGNKTKDCSILIYLVGWSELGEWTCYYHSTEFYEVTEVLAVFTISLGDGWSMGSILAFTISLTFLFGFLVGCVLKWKSCKTSSLWKKKLNIPGLRINSGPSANRSVTID